MKNNDLEFMSCPELVEVIVKQLNESEERKHGRNQCAWCKKDMGVCIGIKPGSVSHGICPHCASVMLAEFAA